MDNSIHRRDFLRKSLHAGLGLSIGLKALDTFAFSPLPNLAAFPFNPSPLDVVRIGFIGAGGMGTSHIRNFTKINGCRIVAVSDILPERVERAQKIIAEAGLDKPDGYSAGPYDFTQICERPDVDLLFIATPWEWHVPMCLEALKKGKHAATEVPAALTLDECWQLVEASEKTGRHCIMMENCNYDREEMMILNLAKKGLLGELLHARCGYLHDLRAVKHDMNGEGVWRRNYSMNRNADLYPTHGLGPVAQWLGINRGNYFDYLVSFSTKTRGLHEYAINRFGPESPQAGEEFVLGDVVTTLIKTFRGETIIVIHDTSNPRPYSRDILLQGTRGLVRKYPEPKLHIEGISEPHQWEDLEAYKDKYDHDLWKNLENEAAGAGHGGMDFLEDFRLINALRNGLEPDMDVYDAAALSAVTPLSEQSIAGGGMPVKFPDFTRGLWEKERTLPVMNL
ncbi:MAG: Gfo/Idh/MocA family oxidoreductase [Bacteroidales bacterium]|nr:Gfo/Idh/MocA family oxidoreductase [Bacteroidales bacterium]